LYTPLSGVTCTDVPIFSAALLLVPSVKVKRLAGWLDSRVLEGVRSRALE
jgi:hypothetical protein